MRSSLSSFVFGLSSFAFVGAASALTYAPTFLPYTDLPDNTELKVSVSLLTEAKIVEGYVDSSFKPLRIVNRAEFLKMVLGLLPDDGAELSLNCFTDVAADVWYARPVCRAKQLGIVRGNALPGTPPELWLFAPERSVQYAEAVKMITEAYKLTVPPASAGDAWYVPYMAFAKKQRLLLPDVSRPDAVLRRGDAARLIARFLASHEGKLAEYETATDTAVTVSGSSSVAAQPDEDLPDFLELLLGGEAQTSSTGSGASAAVASSSSSVKRIYDPDENTDIRQQFLLLGQVSPVLGSAKLFSEMQPLDVEEVIIRLVSGVDSIDAFLVFSEDGVLLGTASVDSSFAGKRQYVLPLKTPLTVPEAEELSIYVRAQLKPKASGGISGELVQIDRIGVRGTGVWDTETHSQFTNEEFLAFETSRSLMESIALGGVEESALVSGSQKRLGSLRIAGRVGGGDSAASLAVTTIRFTINATGGVTLSNVQLSADGFSDRHDCTVAGSTIVCSGIPASFGSCEDGPRTLTVYGDVAIPGNANRASLQLSINNPGNPYEAGDFLWTDGTTTFGWVKGDWPVLNLWTLRQ